MIKVVTFFDWMIEYFGSLGRSFPCFCHKNVVGSPMVTVQLNAIVSPKGTVWFCKSDRTGGSDMVKFTTAVGEHLASEIALQQYRLSSLATVLWNLSWWASLVILSSSKFETSSKRPLLTFNTLNHWMFWANLTVLPVLLRQFIVAPWPSKTHLSEGLAINFQVLVPSKNEHEMI